MDHCAVCRTVIPSNYYRVGTAIACGTCVGTIQENEKANAGKYLRRGLLFACIAAVVCWLVLWGAMELASVAGFMGMFLRGTATLIAGVLIGTAAKDGAKKRGSRTLQIVCVVLTYMAWCLAIAATIAADVPDARRTAALMGQLVLMSPVLPFIIAFKNILAVSGIVVVCMACFAAWRGSEPSELVSGPF